MRIAIGPPQADSRRTMPAPPDSGPTVVRQRMTAGAAFRSRSVSPLPSPHDARPEHDTGKSHKRPYQRRINCCFTDVLAIRGGLTELARLRVVAGTLAVSAALAAAAAFMRARTTTMTAFLRTALALFALALVHSRRHRRAPSRSICCWCSPPTCRAASTTRSSCCSGRATPLRFRTRRCSTPSAPARTARSRSISLNGLASARRRS